MNTNSSLFQELSEEELQRVIGKNLNQNVREAELLEGGLFNTTYRVCCGEEEKNVVLRCGPVNRHLLLPFEENLMRAEETVDRLCKTKQIPCSDVLACDTTKELIDRDYMIVGYIDSVPLSQVPQEQKPGLYREVGAYMRKFHSITSRSFGRVSCLPSGRSFGGWYEFLVSEVSGMLEKSFSFNAFTRQEARQILLAFQKHEDCLRQIKVPRLIHTDLWEGNVLAAQKDGAYSVAAIIDGDRALFGDVDFEFASPWMTNEDFFEGYGKDFCGEDFHSEDRTVRRALYLILYDLIEAYVSIAEYNNPDQYRESKRLILKSAAELI